MLAVPKDKALFLYSMYVCPEKMHSLCNERQGTEFGECLFAYTDINVFYV